jgi:tetratricopeptide (TPR) repeat protein
MRETGIDFAKYVDFYKQQWRDLMELQDRRGAPLYDYGDRSIWTTWTISFKAIQKTNEAATNLLLLWAFLDNRDLWYGLIAAAGEKSTLVAEHLSKWLQDIPSNELKFIDAVQLLRNYSMIESIQGLPSYTTHPVVHKWAFHMQEPEQRVDLARAAILVVGFAVPHNSTKEYWTTQRRLFSHAQSCSQWILDSEAVPSAKGWESSHIAGTDEECRRDVLDAIARLGLLFLDQDKLGKAEKMYQRALQGYKQALGPKHLLTLNTVNGLGTLYKAKGKLGEAEKMFQRALQGKEKALGPDHTSTLDTVNNLGSIYQDQGKLDEAEEMYQRALYGYEKALGVDQSNIHGPALHTVNNLGILYQNQGKLGEAEEMYQRALHGYEKALGPDHTSTLNTVNNLGLLYSNQGKLDEAEKMYQRALQGKEKALGPDHTSTLNTVNNLGILYQNQGKLSEAEKMCQRALHGYEKALGPDHTSILNTVNNLGILYSNQGKLDEAEKMYQRALQGYEKTLGR